MTSFIAFRKYLTGATVAFALMLVQGCATGPSANPADPLEPFNRTMFNFNDNLDRAVLKPVATAYRDIMPALVRTGVSNFFANLSDVWSTVNNLLQFKGEAAADSFMRFTVNSLWGLGGIFDVATPLNISKHSKDFGQTLGYWGVGPGPYLVLPVFGPSTVRDSVGLVVDLKADLVGNLNNVPVRNSLTSLRLVDTRSQLLGAGNMLEQAALDKYSFTRDFYLQRRRSLINNGAAEKEERFDLPEGAPMLDESTHPVIKEERFDLPEETPAGPDAPAK